MDEEKKSVILYTEWAQPLKTLSLEDKGRIFDAILSYSETGETPHFDSAAAEMAFSFIRLRLDVNARKWADVRQKRREAGRLGGKQRQANQANQANATFAKQNKQSQANQAVNVNVNANVNGNVSSNEDIYRGADKPPAPTSSSGQKRFVPPTLEEVAAYCSERHNSVSPSAFVDYYEARGWKYGTGKPMVNWKAAVRTWEQKDKERARTQGSQAGETAAEANARIFDELFGGKRL